jgi:hypothetical protein
MRPLLACLLRYYHKKKTITYGVLLHDLRAAGSLHLLSARAFSGRFGLQCQLRVGAPKKANQRCGETQTEPCPTVVYVKRRESCTVKKSVRAPVDDGRVRGERHARDFQTRRGRARRRPARGLARKRRACARPLL